LKNQTSCSKKKKKKFHAFIFECKKGRFIKSAAGGGAAREDK
jgi:hypothetical protein